MLRRSRPMSWEISTRPSRSIFPLASTRHSMDRPQLRSHSSIWRDRSLREIAIAAMVRKKRSSESINPYARDPDLPKEGCAFPAFFPQHSPADRYHPLRFLFYRLRFGIAPGLEKEFTW